MVYWYTKQLMGVISLRVIAGGVGTRACIRPESHYFWSFRAGKGGWLLRLQGKKSSNHTAPSFPFTSGKRYRVSLSAFMIQRGLGQNIRGQCCAIRVIGAHGTIPWPNACKPRIYGKLCALRYRALPTTAVGKSLG